VRTSLSCSGRDGLVNILKPVLNSRSATVLKRGIPCSTKRLHKKVADQVHSERLAILGRARATLGKTLNRIRRRLVRTGQDARWIERPQLAKALGTEQFCLHICGNAGHVQQHADHLDNQEARVASAHHGVRQRVVFEILLEIELELTKDSDANGKIARLIAFVYVCVACVCGVDCV
jgi:hypothetical protein